VGHKAGIDIASRMKGFPVNFKFRNKLTQSEVEAFRK
jgi:hypothetical protein